MHALVTNGQIDAAGNALLVNISVHDTQRFFIVEVDVLILEDDIALRRNQRDT